MLNNSVNSKKQRSVDHIQESSLDLQHFMSFINYRKLKTIFMTSLNSHVYWDTYINVYFYKTEIGIFEQTRKKNIYFFWSNFGVSRSKSSKFSKMLIHLII